ncbi:YicC/YloC family endoribonuclease [Enterococcus sp. BWR-S5]|uniref:YicC/YloC family endoribonuclease n=1 Tax=Enterococcus sp. BWR-S5 TaxID=2787714 RepID=UPI00192220BE|nr:YicC/YloC family endoribonuclease [Enterococcus sp. BWR-S5]MBL1226837.1 YicC family protein [Enterococcus sp. BWR-S5]
MKSMTGFGKEVLQHETYQIDVEIKTVNHRFLDMQLRMPKEANPYELAIRQLIKEKLQRGRVEVYVNLQKSGEGNKTVHIHWSLIHQLLQNMETELVDNYAIEQFDPTASVNQLLNNADFVEVVEEKTDDTQLEALLLKAIETAVEKVDDSRQQEGEKIRQVLLEYSQDFSTKVQKLISFTELYEADYKERFEAKLKEWLSAHVDETRLLTEMAILLEKGDIHEELDRLLIHIDKLSQLLTQSAPVGRELDFLIQEMNREVNTIGSKSSPIEIKNYVVQLKTILEKIREQIQNVE